MQCGLFQHPERERERERREKRKERTNCAVNFGHERRKKSAINSKAAEIMQTFLLHQSIPGWVSSAICLQRWMNQMINGFPLLSVMGNASGKKGGAGSSSGVNKFEENYDVESAEPMVHSPPHNSLASQNPRDTSSQNTVYNDNVHNEKLRRMKISWNHGGNQVAITGSWDNWETREPLQNIGKEFIVIKLLPSGLYQYRFIVDGCWRCAPDLPWVYDESGSAYNVLDLQEYGLELPERLSKFEPPPSPPSSYDNTRLSDDDFSKPPPEVPPQLQVPFLNKPPSSSNDGDQPLSMPHYSQLNHLYIQNQIGGEFFALSSTHRFRQKFVTMVLYKPLNRANP